MTISERRIEAGLVRAVERRGGIAIKLVSPGWRGAPDRLILAPGGRAAFAEIKASGGRVGPLQRRRLQDLGELGFVAVVLASPEEVSAFIDQFFGKSDNEI